MSSDEWVVRIRGDQAQSLLDSHATSYWPGELTIALKHLVPVFEPELPELPEPSKPVESIESPK